MSKAVLSTHNFLWGKVFDVKHGSKNNNRVSKGLVNIEVTKALICVNVSLYRLH